ncbi:helix-turn-helix domain-containing protein [Agriterribacter sp.]|uniref:helix-turn-helix domain-containing protein n=1 Tax=Agriterribacter sp. TaxID=2821509 RepID=UPI002B84A643|nr:helix-turn-helix domain-containing protein [Agriterribacter sp.]HRO47420.1 helix-turn-helix domain-containing protein [Agriterribacter sp.]HRQ16579.1 helix-turn-helix domain-containing protein [Agriterribacter sp.]
MLYQKFSPCAQLAPFIETYYIWTSQKELVSNLVVESPPNGFCSVVFNTGDAYTLKNKKYDMLAVPGSFIAGQAIYSYSLTLSGCIAVAGIVFKPAGLASLFHLPVYEFTEERIDLKEKISSRLVAHIEEQLKILTDASEKAKLMEQFVLELCHHNIPEPDEIDIAANRIVELNGMLHVNDLLKDIFMSRRNFERKFFKKVGLSPKYYARIRRFSFLMNRIAGKKEADWVQLFSDCAYYDQSHFIKDFIAFTGRTPQQYLEANKELATMIQKPVTKALQ